jgi:hypothetical protein
MSEEEVAHNFWSGRGEGDINPATGHRAKQVTWTYVVEVGSSYSLALYPAYLRCHRTLKLIASPTSSPCTRYPLQPSRSRLSK